MDRSALIVTYMPTELAIRLIDPRIIAKISSGIILIVKMTMVPADRLAAGNFMPN